MSKIRTAFPLENLNYGLVSIHAVVNTGDMTQTIKELQERVATHETVVDSIVDVVAQAAPEWLKVLNTIAEMAVSEDMVYTTRPNYDYSFIEYNGKPCFEFNAATTYFKYRAYCKAASMKPLFPSTAAFIHAINNVSMCESTTYKGTVQGSGNNHVLGLDELRFAGFCPPKFS